MKKALLILTAVLASSLIIGSLALTQNAPRNVVAQVDNGEYSDISAIYLKLDGIRGESIEINHQGWIEIMAFNWSEANRPSRAGVPTGKAMSEEFRIVKWYDKSSPKLFLCCANGSQRKSAQLDVVRGHDESSRIIITYTFTDVSISFYKTSGDISRYPGVLDEFSINFAKLTVHYWQFDEQGQQIGDFEASWDFVLNKGG